MPRLETLHWIVTSTRPKLMPGAAAPALRIDDSNAGIRTRVAVDQHRPRHPVGSLGGGAGITFEGGRLGTRLGGGPHLGACVDVASERDHQDRQADHRRGDQHQPERIGGTAVASPVHGRNPSIGIASVTSMGVDVPRMIPGARPVTRTTTN